MAIEFDCTECGRTMRAPEDAAGRRARCPMCQAIVNVPREEQPLFEAEEVSPPKQDTRPDDFGTPADTPGFGFRDEAEEDDWQSAGRGSAARQEAGRRPCPMCGEMISVDALKCRFCKEIFDETLRRERRRRRSSSGVSEEDLTAGEIVVAILCSTIGCIMGIVWMIQGYPKGTKMFGISFVSSLFWGGIRLAIMSANGEL